MNEMNNMNNYNNFNNYNNNQFVPEKKNNKKYIILIILVLVLALGGIGFYVWKNNEDNTQQETKKTEKKETKKDDDIEEPDEDDEDPGYIDDDEDDSPVTIPDWANKYAAYIKSNFGKSKGEVKGYFLDLMNDKVPELVLFEYDESEHGFTSLLYLDNGEVKRTPKFDEGYLSLLFDISKKGFDGWYLVSFDEESNDTYTYVGELMGGTTKKSFKLSTEQEEKNFARAYIETPFSLIEYRLDGSEFSEKVLADMVKQFNNKKIPNDDVMEYIRETMESRQQ